MAAELYDKSGALLQTVDVPLVGRRVWLGGLVLSLGLQLRSIDGKAAYLAGGWTTGNLDLSRPLRITCPKLEGLL